MQIIDPIVLEACQHQLISPAEAEYVLKLVLINSRPSPLIPNPRLGYYE